MKVVMIKYFFDTESNYQINEMVKAWDSEHELVIISTKYLDYIHKEFKENQILKDQEVELKYNVKIIRLDCWFRIGTRVVFKGLRPLLKKLSPDVLFIHGLGDFNDLIFLFSNNSYLIYRDCHMSWIASKNKFAKYYYKFFSLFFSPMINIFSKYEKVYALGLEEREYIRALGIKSHKIEMLPHGYNKNTYFSSSELRAMKRSELGLSDNTVLISYIGKFDRNKLPDLCLDVYSQFDENFVKTKDIRFLFMGTQEPIYFNEVFKLKFDEFLYKDRVILLPAVSSADLNGFYNASDICFWPKETTLSSIHAQVCNCPVVMGDYLSNKERVLNQSNLFKIDDLNDATKVVLSVVNELPNIHIDSSLLLSREYNHQMSALISGWLEKLNSLKSKKLEG